MVPNDNTQIRVLLFYKIIFLPLNGIVEFKKIIFIIFVFIKFLFQMCTYISCIRNITQLFYLLSQNILSKYSTVSRF